MRVENIVREEKIEKYEHLSSFATNLQKTFDADASKYNIGMWETIYPLKSI